MYSIKCLTNFFDIISSDYLQPQITTGFQVNLNPNFTPLQNPVDNSNQQQSHDTPVQNQNQEPVAPPPPQLRPAPAPQAPQPEGERDDDWLSLLHTIISFLVLFSIIYYYSSLERFLVIFAIVFALVV